MIINRYLSKEIAGLLLGITCVLVLIFMSTQFARYLGMVAAGKLPAMLVFKILLLEIPNLLVLLLPLGFYIAVIIALGRLYADHEMVVLQACGLRPIQLARVIMRIAGALAILIAVLILWVNPSIARSKDQLLSQGRAASIVKTIMPGRFQTLSGGNKVFYVERLNDDRTGARNIFMAERSNNAKSQRWDIVRAKSAKVINKNGQQYLLLNHGFRYSGAPGKGDYQIVKFESYALLIPKLIIKKTTRDDALSMRTLIQGYFNNPNYAAELQWRVSIPIMLLILALWTLTLGRLNPRQGRFAKLIPAIILYLFYANLLFVARNWVQTGFVPIWLGMWWLHAVFLGLLFAWQGGRWFKQSIVKKT